MNAELAALGWDAFFEARLLEATARRHDRAEDAASGDAAPVQAAPGAPCGRVAFLSRGVYQVLLGPERGVFAQLKGGLRHAARRDPEALPTVGDWVLLEPLRPGRALLTALLPRRNALRRREQARREAGRRLAGTQLLAANVDWGLIATSANAEWNPRRLKRYIGLVAEAGARPAVLLTKADLAPDHGRDALKAAQDLVPGVPVLPLETPRGHGLKEVLALLEGRGTAVLLGSSGVGKSTLVNALLGSERMATRSVRERDDHGRHTTVGRHLVPLPQGGCLIDSPGLRELGLVEEGGADAGYAEIAALAQGCRFRDCGHSNEPGCAVRAALEHGELDPGRWKAYAKLRDETRGGIRAQKRRGPARSDRER